ncbi:MAG: hypothetical protein ACK468_19450 [Dolichospermum sp.]|jgi:hypothetical protein
MKDFLKIFKQPQIYIKKNEHELNKAQPNNKINQSWVSFSSLFLRASGSLCEKKIELVDKGVNVLATYQIYKT